jgi:hypothetical protein
LSGALAIEVLEENLCASVISALSESLSDSRLKRGVDGYLDDPACGGDRDRGALRTRERRRTSGSESGSRSCGSLFTYQWRTQFWISQAGIAGGVEVLSVGLGHAVGGSAASSKQQHHADFHHKELWWP